MKYDNINLARTEEREDFKKTQMVDNLKKYIGTGEQKEERIKELSLRSGLSVQTVFITCCTYAGKDDNVLKLHNVLMKILQEYKASLNTEINNNQTVTDEMVQELREFSKTNTADIFKLAEVTGLSPQRVLEIMQSKETSHEDIRVLYRALENLRQEQLKNVNMSTSLENSEEEAKPKAM